MKAIRKWLAVALTMLVLVGVPLLQNPLTHVSAQPHFQLVEWPGFCC